MAILWINAVKQKRFYWKKKLHRKKERKREVSNGGLFLRRLKYAPVFPLLSDDNNNDDYRIPHPILVCRK